MGTRLVGGVLAALLALSAATACGTAPEQVAAGDAAVAGGAEVEVVDTDAAMDRGFDLRRGQTARIKGTKVTVTFREVTEDSRCKPGQTCIWEGDATVALTFAGSRIALHTNKQFPTSAVVGGYQITLLKLDVRGVVATLMVGRVG